MARPVGRKAWLELFIRLMDTKQPARELRTKLGIRMADVPREARRVEEYREELKNLLEKEIAPTKEEFPLTNKPYSKVAGIVGVGKIEDGPIKSFYYEVATPLSDNAVEDLGILPVGTGILVFPKGEAQEPLLRYTNIPGTTDGVTFSGDGIHYLNISAIPSGTPHINV